MGLGEEKFIHPARDEASVMLPPVLDLMPEPSLNLDLYVWLAAAMAVMPLRPMTETDPLQADLALLNAASALEAKVLKTFPGLVDRYRRLCSALLAERRAARCREWKASWKTGSSISCAVVQALRPFSDMG